MNWFNIVNFILALAPQEVALVKAIVDAAHAGHQAGTPLQPVVNPFTQPLGSPSITLADPQAQMGLGNVIVTPALTQSQQVQTSPTALDSVAERQKETPSAVVESPANGVKKTL